MAENSFHGAFVEQLRDLYSAEQQITKALPKLIEAVQNEELRKALDAHLAETRGQIARLDEIFGELDETSRGKTCKGMQGLLEEGEEVLESHETGNLRDALIIGGAQRVEHYEIAAYGTAKAWADELGYDDAVELLENTLEEEGQANEKLTSIATDGLLSEGINQEAAASTK